MLIHNNKYIKFIWLYKIILIIIKKKKIKNKGESNSSFMIKVLLNYILINL